MAFDTRAAAQSMQRDRIFHPAGAYPNRTYRRNRRSPCRSPNTPAHLRAMQQQWIRSICNNMGASAEPGVVETESTTLVRQGKGRNRKAVLDAGAPDPVGQPAVPQVPLENMKNPLHRGVSSSSSSSGSGGTSGAEEPDGNNARKGSMSDFLKFHFGNGKR